MPIPLDPKSNKPIGYRLENGLPMVWFVGYDGEDNNGKRPPTKPPYKPYDIVFYFYEIPAYL